MRASVGEMTGVADELVMLKRRWWRMKRFIVPLIVVFLIVATAILAWNNRFSIANDLLRDQLATYDIPATYRIERIGGTTQVLSNLVVGDPSAPDLTAKRVIVRLHHRLGVPEIGNVTLVEPRLYGTFLGGKLSFGSLDKALFRDTGEPPGLPDFELAVRDGRGLIESDYGPVGLKLEGEGNLSDGFNGLLAASAPSLTIQDCRSEGATLFGRVRTASSKPSFEGPLRTGKVSCNNGQVAISRLVAELDTSTNAELADPSVTARIAADEALIGTNRAETLAATVRAQLRGEAMTGRYAIAARGIATPYALAAVLTANGSVRARQSFARVEIESDVEGNGLRPGGDLHALIGGLQSSGDGTLLEPLARRFGNALLAESRGSSFAADVRYRTDGTAYSLLMPRAEMTGGSGTRILSLSRVELNDRGEGAPKLSGNLASGGADLPRITGRMERGASGKAIFRLRMDPYAASGSQVAIPQLVVTQGDGGKLGFAGRIEASGPLPGGAVDRLALPVSGSWIPGGELAMYRQCTEVGFARLRFAQLNIAGPGVTLCPPTGQAMLRVGNGGVRFAAGAPSLQLVGSLGKTPIRMASGPVGFAWPGTVRARNLDIALGPKDTASRFVISDLDAKVGDNISGNFADAEITLAAVPLNLVNTAGKWDYTAGKVTIGDATFRLVDRQEPDRFEPMIARDGTLTLVDNLISASADLRHPGTDRIVTRANIRHSLATGGGHADLAIDGLEFDRSLQPEQLTARAKGVVANMRGVVTGKGRIDWTPAGEVTSSGQFSSDNLDFAAAFGPVKGASGTVAFSDLINLTTAPGQTIRIGSVNPGIEVLEGEVEFALRDGQILSVAGGSWPFMGGRLILREVDLNIGVSEERRYIFEIVGLQAAQFIAQMELENISATGSFDGTIPIIFDSNGNGRIEGGLLLSRAPGGNVSYVGELTYEDLSPIANYAFDALRSLDYTQMSVGMEGPLTGEIVTRVRFDGVKQGEGAKSNFVTRQLAKLPIQFRINIRAQFYQLMTSMKSLYDPAAVRDPRELGLLSDDGVRMLRRSVTGEEAEPEIDPEDIVPDEPPIQHKESE